MTIILHSNDRDLSICYYYVPDGARESEALDEALYVLWELTPTEGLVQEWRNLMRNGSCRFDYHGCEFSIVKRIGEWEFQIHHEGNA